MNAEKKMILDTLISTWNNKGADDVYSYAEHFEGCFSLLELAEYMLELGYQLNDYVDLIQCFA